MIKDFSVYAIKNLKRRGIRSWLTLLGIFIGIAAVVSLISLGNTLQLAVNAQFGISSTEVISVQAGGLNSYGPPGTGVVNSLTKKNVDEIEKLNYVEVAIGRNIENIRAEFNDRATFPYVTNIPDGKKMDYIYEILDITPHSGRLIQTGDRNKIVLGYDFLDKDKNGFEKAVKTGDKIWINNRSFEVIGMLNKKGSLILDKVVLMDESSLESLMENPEEVDIIAVKVKNKDQMDLAKIEIEKYLRKDRDVKIGEEDFTVSTPQATMSQINQILMGIQIFIVIIAAISIFVGAIGIVNTMTTSVLERKKEIGIMKAIGARNSQIFLQFFIESGMLGLVGGVIGVLIGLGISYGGTAAIGNLLGLNTQQNVDFILIFSALIGSFLIGSVSGIVPAMNAAKQNPVEALKG
jgi:putative ABC transport system permease protein